MKRHRFERQDRFAGLFHWFYVLFEPARGSGRAKLTIHIDQHWHGVGAGCDSEDIADKAGIIHVRAGNSGTDRDNVASSRHVSSSIRAQRYIVTTGAAECECQITYSSIVVAGGAVYQRLVTGRRISAANRVYI